MPLIKRGKPPVPRRLRPTNHQGLDEIKFHTDRPRMRVLVEEDKLSAAMDVALQDWDTAYVRPAADGDPENLGIGIRR